MRPSSRLSTLATASLPGVGETHGAKWGRFPVPSHRVSGVTVECVAQYLCLAANQLNCDLLPLIRRQFVRTYADSHSPARQNAAQCSCA